MFCNLKSRKPRKIQMKWLKCGLLICSVSWLKSIQRIVLICRKDDHIVLLHHKMEFLSSWYKSRHRFWPTQRNKWKYCMYYNKRFPFLNSKYLDDKLKVRQVKLELQRKHSRMILQQRFPSFYKRVFDKVDNMMNFLSNTNRRHYLKYRSYLNKIEKLHASLKNWSPQIYSRMLRISRNPLLVNFQKFPLPI